MIKDKEIEHIKGRYGIIIAIITLLGALIPLFVNYKGSPKEPDKFPYRDNDRLKEPASAPNNGKKPEKVNQ